MRDAAGKSADRLELLSLEKLVLCRLTTADVAVAAVTRIPPALSSGLSMISIGKSVPSLRRAESSIPVPICCASASAAVRRSSAISRSANPSGMMLVTACPTSSSRWYPNCFSACRLSKTMSPDWSTTTIASGAASSSPLYLASDSLLASILATLRTSSPGATECSSQASLLERNPRAVSPRTAAQRANTRGRPEPRRRGRDLVRMKSRGLAQWMRCRRDHSASVGSGRNGDRPPLRRPVEGRRPGNSRATTSRSSPRCGGSGCRRAPS